MKRLLALIPLIALAALAVMFAVKSLNRDPHIIPDAMVGKPAPASTLPGLAGEAPRSVRQLAMTQAAGGPVIVNFFASWCVPCLQEAPTLMALKAQGVRVIGIAYEDDPAASAAFLRRTGNPYSDVLVDRDGRAGVEFGISGVPESYLIGPDGKILGKFGGPLMPDTAETLLESGRPAR